MKRKVIKQGPTTLMVSLPSTWTKKYSIRKGDVLDIDEVDRYLKISTDKDIEIFPVEFDSRNLDIKHIARYLDESYKSGFDEIKIIYSDPKLVPEIQNYISKVLIGYEIIEQRESSLVVKSISKTIEQEFDHILRRAFLVTKQFGTSALEIVRKGDYLPLKDILILEETNDKLTNFCERVLNKKGYKKFNKTTFMYCLVWQIEKIADEYKYMCNYLMSIDGEINDKILDLFEKTNNAFNQFYDLFYNYDKKRLMSFTENCEMLLAESRDKQALSKTRQDIFVASQLNVLISKIYNLIGPFIGTVV